MPYTQCMYAPPPDHPYYEDWALDFSDQPYPKHPPQIDLAAIAVFAWIIIWSLF